MALVSTQPIAETRIRNISWGGGKVDWCVGLTTLSLSYAGCLEILTASTCMPRVLNVFVLEGDLTGY